MKNFLKPRSLNIIDVVIILMILMSLVISIVSAKNQEDVFTDYSEKQIDLENRVFTLEYMNDTLLESGVDSVNGIESTFESFTTEQKERIEYLETTVVGISEILLKINDWTIKSDKRFNELVNTLSGSY